LILTVLPRDAGFGWAPAQSVQKVDASDGARRQTHWATGAWGIVIAALALIVWWLSK
jgi:hypothetical protein